MISKLDHSILETGTMIHAIFQSSYAVEAALLNHHDFPPLKRTIREIQQSATSFYGYYLSNQMCAVIELEIYDNHIHIRSLTVDPQFFRQGIGQFLLGFVRDQFKAELITVETGHGNYPAVNFYLNFGFKKDKVWMTDVGIEKISFILDKKM